MPTKTCRILAEFQGCQISCRICGRSEFGQIRQVSVAKFGKFSRADKNKFGKFSDENLQNSCRRKLAEFSVFFVTCPLFCVFFEKFGKFSSATPENSAGNSAGNSAENLPNSASNSAKKSATRIGTSEREFGSAFGTKFGKFTLPPARPDAGRLAGAGWVDVAGWLAGWVAGWLAGLAGLAGWLGWLAGGRAHNMIRKYDLKICHFVLCLYAVQMWHVLVCTIKSEQQPPKRTKNKRKIGKNALGGILT